MAWANSAISDVIATTIESRTRKAADNLTNNNALLTYIKKSGNLKPISGGSVVLQEIMYDDATGGNAAAYSGYETLNISPDTPISAASFNLCHYAAAVSISGPEMLANSGKEQMIDLLSTRVAIAEARLQNKINNDLHALAASSSGKGFTGLADMLTTSSTTGSYGGIDRATWTFWQHKYTSTSSSTTSNVQSRMNDMANALVRGVDRTNLILAGVNAYNLYLGSLQAIQRITNEEGSSGAGFTALKYYGNGGGADVILGDGLSMTGSGTLTSNFSANDMLFLNTKHIFFRPHKDRNFVAIGGDRQSVNQDAIVRLYGFSGALTCDGLKFQGRLVLTP